MERKIVSKIMLCLILLSVIAIAVNVQTTKACEGEPVIITPDPNVILTFPSGSIVEATAVQRYPPVTTPPPGDEASTTSTTEIVSPPSGFVAIWDIRVTGTFSGDVFVKIYALEPVTQMFRAEFIPGDVNGDGKVNLLDLCIITKALGSTPGTRKWNPYCDLNNNGKVDLKDLCIAIRNFGKTSAWTNITDSFGYDDNGFFVIGITPHFSAFGIH
jgi:hypothetical protein